MLTLTKKKTSVPNVFILYCGHKMRSMELIRYTCGMQHLVTIKICTHHRQGKNVFVSYWYLVITLKQKKINHSSYLCIKKEQVKKNTLNADINNKKMFQKTLFKIILAIV